MANGDFDPTVKPQDIAQALQALLQRQPARTSLTGAQFQDVAPSSQPLSPAPPPSPYDSEAQRFRTRLERAGETELDRPIPQPIVPGMKIDASGTPSFHRTKADLISTFLNPLAAAFGASMTGPRYNSGRRFLGNLVATGVPTGLQYAQLPAMRRMQVAEMQAPYIKQRTELLKALAPLARVPNMKPVAGTVSGKPASAYWDEMNRTWIDTQTNTPVPDFIPTRFESTAAGAAAKQEAIWPGKKQQAVELGQIRTDEAIRRYNLMTPAVLERATKLFADEEPFKVDQAKKIFQAELPDRMRAAKILAGYQSSLVEGRELTRAEQAEQKIASAVTTGSDIWDGMIAHGEKPEANPIDFLNHAYAILQSAAQREGTPAAEANVLPTMKYIAARISPNLKGQQMVQAVEGMMAALGGGQPQQPATAPAQ